MLLEQASEARPRPGFPMRLPGCEKSGLSGGPPGRGPMRGTLLRARIVVPVCGAPIVNGAVRVGAGRVCAVGRWRDLCLGDRARVCDLGEVALLPGLVNAHCHLDYTDMAGQLAPLNSFTDWIKSITELKEGWSRADYADSWRRGARMLLASGTTTVADMEAVPDLLPEMWDQTPLRVVSFLEMTGVRSRRAPGAVVGEALTRAAALRHARCRIGLSPHAPYSTTPELMRRSVAAARQRRWPVSTHVAESAEEFEMFVGRRGPMFDWIRRNERDMSDCGGVSPVQALARTGVLGARLMAVHANYLGPGDAETLGRAGVSVVHCPRSHVYFRHQPFPAEELAKAGVGLSLGTDSLATVYKRRHEEVRLDLLTEMRLFADAHSSFRPSAIVRMGTTHAARALGWAGRVGEIRAGAHADFVAIPYRGGVGEVSSGVLGHEGPVEAVMIGGRWVFGPWAGAVC